MRAGMSSWMVELMAAYSPPMPTVQPLRVALAVPVSAPLV